MRLIEDKGLAFIDYGSVAVATAVYKACVQGLWIYDSQVWV